MPIYAYRCESCGHAQDVLQKLSDPLLTVCPACGQPTYRKQLTAAGFQLKGSGWYVTDFRGGNAAAGAKPEAEPDAKVEPPADAAKGGDKQPAAGTEAAKPAAVSPASPATTSAAAAPPSTSGGGSTPSA